MKRTILFLVAIALCFSVLSQEKIKQKEVGFVFSSFDNFGLLLKKGNNKMMWRFTTMVMSGNKQEYPTDSLTISNYGVGLAIGNEFRKKVSDNFEFCFGYDLSFNYSRNKNESLKAFPNSQITKTSYLTPGINLVFGVNYIVKEYLVLGVEVLPYYQRVTKYVYDKYDTLQSKSKGFQYGLSNTSARLSVAYRF